MSPRALSCLAGLLLFATPALAGLSPDSGMPLTGGSGLKLRNTLLPVADPGLQCRQAIQVAERAAGIPTQLMAAIARIESGRSDAQGSVNPWPWTINAEGQGHYYASKAEAIAAALAMQARGLRSMDVGCMQVNLAYHPDAFANLDQAFDPALNATYAAKFLTQLFGQTHDWTRTTAYYHSATPDLGADYQRKVAAVLPDEQKRVGAMPQLQLAAGGNVWSNNVWSTNVWNDHGSAWPTQGNALAGGVLQAGTVDRTAMAAGAVGGGYMLSNRAASARMIPLAQGIGGGAGRTLTAYRATPIPLASR